MSAVQIEVLEHPQEAELQQLAEVLIDCVEGGASVSFMLPIHQERAVSFWRRVTEEAQEGARRILVARDSQGICGTVQLILSLPENQPHRADVAKMLVHRRARKQGVGTALLQATEAEAKRHQRTLLVLDTVTGSDASRLYERLGWIRSGDIPRYALWPAGGECSTTYYYRDLSR